MSEPRTVAIVPARGGSERIPRKNLLSVGGKPLLVHTLEHARRCEQIDALYVSTDDAEIAGVARAHGAEVIERPADLAGAHASSESALAHALGWLGERGIAPELVAFLQCTSPLRADGDLGRAIDGLRDAAADSLFSACRNRRMFWRRSAQDELESLNYDHRRRPRTQDFEPQWMENGSIYLFKPWVLERTGNRLGGKIAVYEMGETESIEIDSPEDAELCDWLLRRRERAGAVKFPREIDAVVFDFDGVLTDDHVWVDEQGHELVRCDRGDGLGVARLREAGIPVWVLSSESNPVVAARCRKLGVPVQQGLRDKGAALGALAAEHGFDLGRVVYVGNDVNDLSCMEQVGFSVAVADAVALVRERADWVLARPGGRGAVRELCERILAERGGGADGNDGQARR
jgi:YrbI family 3-deoxy-D-manno-octulosonate 8-phosphate phosphatase